jgi:hypothetical protein
MKKYMIAVIFLGLCVIGCSAALQSLNIPYKAVLQIVELAGVGLQLDLQTIENNRPQFEQLSTKYGVDITTSSMKLLQDLKILEADKTDAVTAYKALYAAMKSMRGIDPADQQVLDALAKLFD